MLMTICIITYLLGTDASEFTTCHGSLHFEINYVVRDSNPIATLS